MHSVICFAELKINGGWDSPSHRFDSNVARFLLLLHAFREVAVEEGYGFNALEELR